MKANKDIQKHLNKLMSSAEKPSHLTTNEDFENKLFARFDEIDTQNRSKQATIFSFSEAQKYAAIFIFLILNISVILFYTSNLNTDNETKDLVTEYSDDYFPDYATLTSLE